MAPLLEIIDLDVVFQTRRKALKAIDNLSVTIEPGEILGFVGAVSYTHLTLPTILLV